MKHDHSDGQISSTGPSQTATSYVASDQPQPNGWNPAALRISVALCTYNGERYLQEQLNSIAAQTRLPEEVIVCDDDSSDSTRKILASFAAAVPFRVQIEHNSPRMGSTPNFEKTIRLCTGDLIALCDQDDIWGPEKLSVQAVHFERDPSLGGVFSDAVLVNSDSNPTGCTLWQSIDFAPSRQHQLRSENAVSVLLYRSVVTGATLMFRSNLVPVICPISPIWVHDGWIAMVIALRSKLDLIPESLSYYRVHSIQQCGVLSSPLQRIRKAQQAASSEYLATAEQLQDLCKYLETTPGFAQAPWDLIQRMIQHLRVRAGLPSNRLARFARLLPELQNYRRFSKGWKSMLKDLII